LVWQPKERRKQFEAFKNCGQTPVFAHAEFDSAASTTHVIAHKPIGDDPHTTSARENHHLWATDSRSMEILNIRESNNPEENFAKEGKINIDPSTKMLCRTRALKRTKIQESAKNVKRSQTHYCH
jgi:hypothetical protein